MILSVGSVIMDGEKREYALDDIIGYGGFGVVYKAHRENDGKIFAIKTSLPQFMDKSSEDAFMNEIRAALKVNGDNVIRYKFAHSGKEYPDLPPYIIMEYANEGSLREVINKRKEAKALFTNEELIAIFRQLANGMKEINTLLVHRDIKPENILLCDSVLKISDFGLSKVAIEKTRTMTFKGAGTPLYMAPEAWDFSKNTIQMDIYSMGIIFYELATLEYPYNPFPKTLDDAKDLHLYSPIQNINNYNCGITPRLVSIINRMLEKSLKRRFQDWGEIIQALALPSDPIPSSDNLDNIVAMAVTAKNNLNLQRQERESELQRKEKDRADFCRLVRSQFDNTIISVLKQYVDKINLEYAGPDKAQLEYNGNIVSCQNYISCRLVVWENRYVEIRIEIVLKENHVRKVPIDSVWNGSQTYKQEEYIPQYHGKNIMAFGEIINSEGLGYNLLLIDSGGIYGDWIIMKNHNNLSFLSPDKMKDEPFAFSIKDLPKEINLVQITNLYRADFEKYDDDMFIRLVNELALL